MARRRADRERQEADLDAEIRAHLDLEAAEQVERGLPEAEARLAARRAFGNVGAVRERVRDAWGWTPLEQLAQDTRFAVRTLWRSPGFTAAAVLSLALGIGMNGGIFSLADALVFRPLAVLDPDSLLVVRSTSRENPSSGVSYADFRDLRERARTLDMLVAHRLSILPFSKTPEATPQLRMGMRVTSGFFQALGVAPVVGRAFLPEETEVAGRDAVVILSHAFWQSEFGGDPSVVARSVRVGQTLATVVGVAPARFAGMDPIIQPFMYVPATLGERLGERLPTGEPASVLDRRDELGFIVRGRLRDGVARADAESEIASLARALETQYPDTNRGRSLVIRTEADLRAEQAPALPAMMALLLGLSGLVLAIVCANVANLLLSRARARSREMAIRLSIGAGQFRLVRQLLTESALVGLIGAAAGLALAYGVIRYLRSISIPTDTPIVIAAQMDGRVLGFSAALTMASVIAFGLLPARRAGRVDLVTTLKRGDVHAPRRQRMIGRQVLVVGQIAVSLVLLVATGLVLDAFRRMATLDTGFRTERTLVMEMDPGTAGYSEPEAREFYRELVDRVRALPGVRSASLSRAVPFRPSFSEELIIPEGYQLPPGQAGVRISTNRVDDAYFDTLGMELLSGRGITAEDRPGTRLTAVVNDTFAKTYWPGEDPIARRFRIGPEGSWIEIVGVARTAKYVNIAEPPQPYIFLPLEQHRISRLNLLVHTAGDPLAVAAPVRDVVRGLDPALPVGTARSLQSIYEDGALGVQRLVLQLVTSMGALGLALALVGLYAVVAYSVRRRMREFGVRMSIGATRRDVIGLVLRESLVLAGAGIVIGLVLSLPVTRALGHALAGVGPLSPWIIAIVPVGLLLVTMAACLGPAWQASRVDPVAVLRLD